MPSRDASRELDALVAEKVMGWKPHLFGNFPWQMQPPDEPHVNGIPQVRLVPRYSTDLAAAWTVHLAMCARLFSTRVRYLDALREESRSPEGWLPDGLHALVVLRDRFPLAICHAALAAVEAP